MKAEGIDRLVNELFSLINRSCKYSASVILPEWSTCFGAILRASVHSSEVSSASLGEDMNHYHHLMLEVSWALDPMRKAKVDDILLPKEESQQGMRKPGNDNGILTAPCAFRLTRGDQKRASLNPYWYNHPSTCWKAEEVQNPLILHPKPLAAVLDQCSVRNSLKGMSPSSWVLASTQSGTASLPSQGRVLREEWEWERKAVQKWMAI